MTENAPTTFTRGAKLPSQRLHLGGTPAGPWDKVSRQVTVSTVNGQLGLDYGSATYEGETVKVVRPHGTDGVWFDWTGSYDLARIVEHAVPRPNPFTVSAPMTRDAELTPGQRVLVNAGGLHQGKPGRVVGLHSTQPELGRWRVIPDGATWREALALYPTQLRSLAAQDVALAFAQIALGQAFHLVTRQPMADRGATVDAAKRALGWLPGWDELHAMELRVARGLAEAAAKLGSSDENMDELEAWVALARGVLGNHNPATWPYVEPKSAMVHFPNGAPFGLYVGERLVARRATTRGAGAYLVHRATTGRRVGDTWSWGRICDVEINGPDLTRERMRPEWDNAGASPAEGWGFGLAANYQIRERVDMIRWTRLVVATAMSRVPFSATMPDGAEATLDLIRAQAHELLTA